MSAKIGDVFEIAVAPRRACYGHIILRRRPIFYMALYEGVYRQQPDLDELLKSSFCLVGNFFGIKLENGDWKVVGNRKPDLSRVPVPSYKVKHGDNFVVESWDGLRRRKATAEEIMMLDFPTNYSAMVLENAARALCGLQPWERLYNKLRPDYVASRVLLF